MQLSCKGTFNTMHTHGSLGGFQLHTLVLSQTSSRLDTFISTQRHTCHAKTHSSCKDSLSMQRHKHPCKDKTPWCLKLDKITMTLLVKHNSMQRHKKASTLTAHYASSRQTTSLCKLKTKPSSPCTLTAHTLNFTHLLCELKSKRKEKQRHKRKPTLTAHYHHANSRFTKQRQHSPCNSRLGQQHAKTLPFPCKKHKRKKKEL